MIISLIVVTMLGTATCSTKNDSDVKFSAKNWKTTVFADPKRPNSGDTRNSTGAVTLERLWSLDTKGEYFCAFPLNRNLPKGSTPIVSNKKQLRGKYLLITNPKNGKSVKARIVDRGPGRGGVLDVSKAVKRDLGFPVDWRSNPSKDRVDVKLVSK